MKTNKGSCGRSLCPGICSRVCYCAAGKKRAAQLAAAYREKRERRKTTGTNTHETPNEPIGVCHWPPDCQLPIPFIYPIDKDNTIEYNIITNQTRKP